MLRKNSSKKIEKLEMGAALKKSSGGVEEYECIQTIRSNAGYRLLVALIESKLLRTGSKMNNSLRSNMFILDPWRNFDSIRATAITASAFERMVCMHSYSDKVWRRLFQWLLCWTLFEVLVL